MLDVPRGKIILQSLEAFLDLSRGNVGDRDSKSTKGSDKKWVKVEQLRLGYFLMKKRPKFQCRKPEMNATAEYIFKVIIWNLMQLCLNNKNDCLNCTVLLEALDIEHTLRSRHSVPEVSLSPEWLFEFIICFCRSFVFH